MFSGQNFANSKNVYAVNIKNKKKTKINIETFIMTYKVMERGKGLSSEYHVHNNQTIIKDHNKNPQNNRNVKNQDTSIWTYLGTNVFLMPNEKKHRKKLSPSSIES